MVTKPKTCNHNSVCLHPPFLHQYLDCNPPGAGTCLFRKASPTQTSKDCTCSICSLPTTLRPLPHLLTHSVSCNNPPMLCCSLAGCSAADSVDLDKDNRDEKARTVYTHTHTHTFLNAVAVQSYTGVTPASSSTTVLLRYPLSQVGYFALYS